MCLAVPAKIVSCSADEARVDLGGNQLQISRVLTPEASEGDWVLVHAGFSIARIDEADALETWEYLRKARWEGVAEEAGAESRAEP